MMQQLQPTIFVIDFISFLNATICALNSYEHNKERKNFVWQVYIFYTQIKKKLVKKNIWIEEKLS